MWWCKLWMTASAWVTENTHDEVLCWVCPRLPLCLPLSTTHHHCTAAFSPEHSGACYATQRLDMHEAHTHIHTHTNWNKTRGYCLNIWFSAIHKIPIERVSHISKSLNQRQYESKPSVCTDSKRKWEDSTLALTYSTTLIRQVQQWNGPICIYVYCMCTVCAPEWPIKWICLYFKQDGNKTSDYCVKKYAQGKGTTVIVYSQKKFQKHYFRSSSLDEFVSTTAS